jgi:hypothetical protein
MPLFEWSSSTQAPGAAGKFWIYWTATIPATIFVLVIWRLWYVFDEWRWSREEKGTIYRDIRAWLGSGSAEQCAKGDLESGKTS